MSAKHFQTNEVIFKICEHLESHEEVVEIHPKGAIVHLSPRFFLAPEVSDASAPQLTSSQAWKRLFNALYGCS